MMRRWNIVFERSWTCYTDCIAQHEPLIRKPRSGCYTLTHKTRHSNDRERERTASENQNILTQNANKSLIINSALC